MGQIRGEIGGKTAVFPHTHTPNNARQENGVADDADWGGFSRIFLTAVSLHRYRHTFPTTAPLL
ncbi:MAG: hypothetical protein KDE56_12800 [Anaerolineales bacterium]|nr:hypothetical protein [Anaerolineales bacterium]